MKALSLQTFGKDALAALERFPLPILCGAIFAGAIIGESRDEAFVMTAALGISLLTGIALFCERRGWGFGPNIVANVAGIALLVLNYMALEGDRLQDSDSMRFALFAIAAHLFVAFAPFTVRGGINGFWQFNRTLFVRVLTAALYTGVLYGGLALALVAVDRLFDLDVDAETYAKMFALMVGVFSAWFFLAGVPDDLEAIENTTDYPKALKAFTQYVLLPLVTLYLVILYLYAGKIIVTWEWPRGWVSALVLSFAVAGVLSFLLLYPVRDRQEFAWIRKFNVWFFRLMAPLIVLLGLSIWLRVEEYGITEPRYFVIALAVWLAGITAYFIISRVDNIKVIPISLCAVALLVSVGPWGAFEVSVASQSARLRTLMERTGMLAGGKVVKPGESLSDRDRNTLTSIVYYLDRRDRLADIQGWFPDSLRPLSSSRALAFLKIPGYEDYGYADDIDSSADWRTCTLTSEGRDQFVVSGFDYMVMLDAPAQYLTKPHVAVGGDTVAVHYDDGIGTVDVSWNDTSRAPVRIDLHAFVRAISDSLRRELERDANATGLDDLAIPAERLSVPSQDARGRLQIRRLDFKHAKSGQVRIGYVDAAVMVKR